MFNKEKTKTANDTNKKLSEKFEYPIPLRNDQNLPCSRFLLNSETVDNF